VLLAGHWAALRFVPVHGVGSAGQFTPDENFVAHLNTAYLAPLHLSGLVSVVPTSALVLLGTAAGDALRRESFGLLHRLAALLLGGLFLALLGLVWSRDLPMNKPLWTAPYILYTAGLASITLGLLYLFIDVGPQTKKRWWGWWALPLVVTGTNAIVAYVAPILVKVNVLQTWTWQMPDGGRLPLEQALQHASYGWLGRVPGGWFYTLVYVGVWWLVLLWLYRKRIFLRV